MVVTVDGKQIAEDFIEGDTNYKYDHAKCMVGNPDPPGRAIVAICW
jgi:hypothetical protein